MTHLRRAWQQFVAGVALCVLVSVTGCGNDPGALAGSGVSTTEVAATPVATTAAVAATPTLTAAALPSPVPVPSPAPAPSPTARAIQEPTPSPTSAPPTLAPTVHASGDSAQATAIQIPTSTAVPPTDSQQVLATNGGEVYTLNCARCHGENGTGSAQYSAGLIGVGSQYSAQGMIAELTTGHPVTFGFAGRLSADEIASVVAYVKSAFP